MTSLGKAIVLTGIAILAIGTICWIIQNDWRWFAGAATFFFCSILSAGVLTVETKSTTPRPAPTPQPQPQQQINDDGWQQPTTPPPDQENDHDAFFGGK